MLYVQTHSDLLNKYLSQKLSATNLQQINILTKGMYTPTFLIHKESVCVKKEISFFIPHCLHSDGHQVLADHCCFLFYPH